MLPGLEVPATPSKTRPLPMAPKLPRCFDYRRLVQWRGRWYWFPDEEPPPEGEGEGKIVRYAPKPKDAVIWQSRETYKTGQKKGQHRQGRLLPLVDDQVEAIRVATWLDRKCRSPLERVKYLVRHHRALVVVNTSGGKDSQAMYLHLTRDLQLPRDQVVVVHADLPGSDWPGTTEHVHKIVDQHPVTVVRAVWGKGKEAGLVKTLHDYVLHRGKFPSAAQRYCTSDLKRGPIDKWIRNLVCHRNGFPGTPCKIPKDGERVIINCMGLRADESQARAQLPEWELSVDDCKSGRVWFDWLPIHAWDVDKVFHTIKRHGQEPFWIYGQTPEHRRRLKAAGSVDAQGKPVGMERMSCQFCILSSLSDIGVASLLSPKGAQAICGLEEKTGHTFRAGITMPELIGKGQKAVAKGGGSQGKRRRLPLARGRQKRRGPCQ